MVAGLAVLAGNVLAGSARHQWGPKGGPFYQEGCLTDDGANYLIQGYTYLLEHPGGPDFNSTASAILSDKFSVLSDSINFLSNKPVS